VKKVKGYEEDIIVSRGEELSGGFAAYERNFYINVVSIPR
jgi:hypothetical protein